MRIVLFNIGLSGGAGKVMLNLAEAFIDSGVEVHIITLKAPQYEISDGILFHNLQLSISSNSKAVFFLKEKLNSIGKFDAIFSNSTPSNRILYRLGVKNSFHIVHSAEIKNYRGIFGGLRAYIRKKKYQKLYSDRDLITVSKGIERFILDELKAKPKSLRTIYNPFDFARIEELSKEQTQNIPEEPFIVHVARYDITQKRHDILLKAYKKSNLPHKLYLIGDGEDREKISKIVEELNLKSRVVLLGFTPNPYPWIRMAKLLLLSSDFEGFGLVLVEALSLKTPVVSTDCREGPREILKGDLAKFLVPVGDVDSLSKKMVQAMDSYPDINCIDFEDLKADNISQKYINLIEETSKWR
jgi:glycosyltransferase involved in cell wall biosynthesis